MEDFISPKLFKGGEHADFRGKLIHFNNLDISAVKRFYVIEHPDTEVVRAWQGHKREQKWFYVLTGEFKIVLLHPDDWNSPSLGLEHQEYTLTVENNQILHVPGGFLNGFKAQVANSRMMIFSDLSADESATDDFRYEKTLWYNW